VFVSRPSCRSSAPRSAIEDKAATACLRILLPGLLITFIRTTAMRTLIRRNLSGSWHLGEEYGKERAYANMSGCFDPISRELNPSILRHAGPGGTPDRPAAVGPTVFGHDESAVHPRALQVATADGGRTPRSTGRTPICRCAPCADLAKAVLSRPARLLMNTHDRETPSPRVEAACGLFPRLRRATLSPMHARPRATSDLVIETELKPL